MRATAEHVRRIRRCTHVLAAEQDVLGGWGLTRGQPPSLVNTAEALVVLHAAQLSGSTVEAGFGYLTHNVADHCSPRASGGRGEKTRYVAFTLWALAECGHDNIEGLVETVTWILGWLEKNRQEDGWSEEVGHDYRYALDTCRLRTELGWRPTIALADGLAQTVDWYRSHEDWWRPLKSGEYWDYYRQNCKALAPA